MVAKTAFKRLTGVGEKERERERDGEKRGGSMSIAGDWQCVKFSTLKYTLPLGHSLPHGQESVSRF